MARLYLRGRNVRKHKGSFKGSLKGGTRVQGFRVYRV